MTFSTIPTRYSEILNVAYAFSQVQINTDECDSSSVIIGYSFLLPDLLEFSTRKMQAVVIAATDGSKTCRHLMSSVVNTFVKCRIPVNDLGELIIIEGGSSSQNVLEYWAGNKLKYRKLLSNIKDISVSLGLPSVFFGRAVFISEEMDPKFARGYWDEKPDMVNPFNKFRLNPDYGETMLKIKNPKITLIDIESGEFIQLPVDPNTHPSYPVLRENHLFLCAMDIRSKTHVPGISRCFNRPSHIRRLSGERFTQSTNLTPGLYMALAPVVSPDGSKLVFAGHATKFSPHCTQLDLFLITDFETPSDPRLLNIPCITDTGPAPVYNGLYLSAQTEAELLQFMPDNRTILVPSYTRGRSGVFIIDTVTELVLHSLFPPGATECTSVMLQKSDGYDVVFLHQGYTCLRSLWLARIDPADFKKIEYVQIFESPIPKLCDGFMHAKISVIQSENCSAWLLQSGLAPGTSKPLIAYLHGGPHMAAITQFSVEMAAFLSHGYDIVIPNYRGSFSYGRDFLNSLIGKAGIIDVQDCHDCVLLAKQMLTSSRVVAYGGSHGGFLAGWLLGHPKMKDTYHLGVLWNPAVDLVSSNLTSDIPEWSVCEAMDEHDQSGINVFAPSIEFFQRAVQQSPMSVVNNINVPSLVLLGANDKRVVPCAGLRWAQAVERNAKTTVDVMWYPEQGHAISSPEFYETAIVTIGIWLEQHI